MCDCGHTFHRNQARASLQSRFNADPTRTLRIQRAFIRELRLRFKKLKSEIVDLVVNKDVFGLFPRTHEVSVLATPTARQWEFATDADKLNSFMSWLGEMESQGILSTTTAATPTGFRSTPWSNTYIQSAYQQGISRAMEEMRKQGVSIPDTTETGADPIISAFNKPFHADRVALIYTRAFNELKGITDAMNQQISRVLAEGMAEGRGARHIARMLLNRVDKIGERRAISMARTEVVRAHHLANINEYESWGILNVRVLVEWATAGYRVCPKCQRLAGQVFTLEQIRGMIPYHPNCRCVAIPIIQR